MADPEKVASVSSASSVASNDAHRGVVISEASYKVFGKYSKWALFISLGLAAYMYSLDGTTTYFYLAWATSDFRLHSLLAAIQVAQAVIIAVGKPIIAKFADTVSRGNSYVLVVVSYVLGYIIIASSKNVQGIAGGKVFYALGYTGLQLLTQIVIADITTLKWRGLVSALISSPFIINGFVGSIIAAEVAGPLGTGWRWGYGMFAILVPVTVGPLLVTLLWAERKAKRQGLIPPRVKRQGTIFQSVQKFCSELDIIGLLLIGTSVALVLLPMTLARRAKGGWDNPSMIVMIVIGFVLAPVFVFYEWKFAKYPVIPARFLKNPSFIGAATIGFFDFISFYLTFAYLYSFVVVVKPWTPRNTNYFTSTQTIALTVFGIMGGLLMRATHRYKWVLCTGLGIRLLGVGIMIHARAVNASDAEVVMAQIIQGIGGGFAAVTSQVAAQASVPHADVATITAAVLLITEIGGAIGNAIAGAIWTDRMPGALAKHLPGVPQEQIAALYGSITAVIQFPRGSPIREGVIEAYAEVMHTMLIVAIATAVIPFVVSFFMPNWYLGDQQNAADESNLEGDVKAAATAQNEEKRSGAWWSRRKD